MGTVGTGETGETLGLTIKFCQVTLLLKHEILKKLVTCILANGYRYEPLAPPVLGWIRTKYETNLN